MKKKKTEYYQYPDLIEPRIGMGATLGVGSDCYPATIVEMNKEKTKIIIQQDSFEPDKDNGYDFYSNQVYIITPDPIAKRRIFSLRKNGSWVEMLGKQRLSVGHRRAYQDPSF